MRVLRENKRRLMRESKRGVSCSELARQMGGIQNHYASLSEV